VNAPTRAPAPAPAPAPEPPARAPDAPPPHAADPIGTANPLVFQAADPDARWVALCQARSDTNHDGAVRVDVGYHGDVYGDRMSLYLVRGSGAGEEIDDFVATDPSGRHVVFVRHGKLVYFDAAKGSMAEIAGADVRPDPSPFGGSRVASFDSAGSQMLYIRSGKAIVRELASGKERTIDPGQGDLYRASFDPDGGWIVLQVVAKDTDGNGKLEWPTPRTTLSGARCRGPIAVYGVYGGSGDTPVMRVASARGGPAREVPDLVRPLGASLLRRVAGALVVEEPSGATHELVPASCDARMYDADGATGQVVAACASQGETAPLVLYGPTGVKPLGVNLSVPHQDSWHRVPRRVSTIGNTVVDFDVRVARTFPADEDLLRFSGHSALVRVAGGLAVHDASNGSRKKIDFAPKPYGAVLQEGDFVAVEGEGKVGVVSLASAALVGAVSGHPLAVTRDGHVLVVDPSPSMGIPQGPARWAAPR
jgi:hypothetical protein